MPYKPGESPHPEILIDGNILEGRCVNREQYGFLVINHGAILVTQRSSEGCLVYQRNSYFPRYKLVGKITSFEGQLEAVPTGRNIDFEDIFENSPTCIIFLDSRDLENNKSKLENPQPNRIGSEEDGYDEYGDGEEEDIYDGEYQ